MALVLRLLIGCLLMIPAAQAEPLNLASPLQAIKESILLRQEFFPDEKFIGAMLRADEKNYRISEFAAITDHSANENSFTCPRRNPNDDVWSPTCQWQDRGFADHIRPPQNYFDWQKAMGSFESAEGFYNKVYKGEEASINSVIVWQLGGKVGFGYELLVGGKDVQFRFTCMPNHKSWICENEK